MNALRARTRRSVLDAIGGALHATGAAERLLSRSATHLIYLHHVPDLDWFRQLVDGLAQRFTLLSPDDAFARIARGHHDGPAVSFSFDDGFVSAGAAAEVLARRGVTCVQYVCPSLVGQGHETVARLLGGRQPEAVMSWSRLESLAQDGHVIASHSRTHRDLSTCSTGELEEEIGGARADLRSRFGECEHFAWPYGRPQHFSDEAYRIALEAGHRTIASAVRGTHAAGRTGVHLRHVVHPAQSLAEVETFLCLARLRADGHDAERRWVAALPTTATTT